MTARRILIIRPDRIGDVVLTTPLIRAVKDTFSDSFVAVMVGSYTLPILEHNPHIDKIITDDPEDKDAGRSGFWNQVKLLRDMQFDTGLMPLPKERHAWMMFFAGIKTRIGVGGKIYQLLTGTQSVSRNKYIPLRHEADYVMDLGRKIGVISNDLTPEIRITQEEREFGRLFFQERGIDFSKPLIGINPGSKGSSPNWKPDRYVLLVQKLSESYQVFVNVGPKGSGFDQHFQNLSNRCIVYAPQNIRELISLASQLSLLISPSTGTMHIASALKVPTVSLFCPLTACSPKLWGPLGNTSEILFPDEGYCQGRCPGDPKICTFDEISIERVLIEVKKMLNS